MKQIILLCGPTAVGKSKVAMQLAEKFKGEIVSADSGQVWEGLDIGTAKPSFEERRRVPYHLIDVVKPGEHFDVAQYIHLADQALEEITGRRHLPIVVGGAGMYIRILLYGLCEAPPQDTTIRQKLADRMEEEGLENLYEELKKIDPPAAKNIHPNDKTRIVRALEVYQITGRPLSFFQKRHRFQNPRYEALQIGLNCDRNLLHQNIERRVDWMIANGWAEEVRELLKFYSSDSQALQSIGYKQIVQYLKGKISLEEAVAKIKRQTKAFARRQLTWFHADKTIQWMEPSNFKEIVSPVEVYTASNF